MAAETDPMGRSFLVLVTGVAVVLIEALALTGLTYVVHELWWPIIPVMGFGTALTVGIITAAAVGVAAAAKKLIDLLTDPS